MHVDGTMWLGVVFGVIIPSGCMKVVKGIKAEPQDWWEEEIHKCCIQTVPFLHTPVLKTTVVANRARLTWDTHRQ